MFLALIVVGGLLSYIVSFCVYRIYLHPLASFPGPTIAKLTSFYAAYHGWKGDVHKDMWRCHQKYGDYVRYGPNQLLFNTATAHEEIYGNGSKLLKSPQYGVLANRTPSILTIHDKKIHSSRRRLLRQGLSSMSIDIFEPHIKALARKLCSKLAQDQEMINGEEVTTTTSGWSAAKNMSRWLDYLFFDMMTTIVFGVDYDLLGKHDLRSIPKAIEASNIRLSAMIQSPTLHNFVTWLNCDKLLFPKSISGRSQFVKFIRRVTGESRKPSLTNSHTVVSALAGDRKFEPTQMADLFADCATLIVAGSDTTATAMASTMFYLSRSPSIHAEVTEEVRSNFASADDIKLGPALSRCRLMRACIEESMRLSPPVGSALWRQTSSEEITIDGYSIPPNTIVGTGLYALHHKAEYFPFPYAFRPERFLNAEVVSSEVEVKCPTFVPFSIGSRGCIGRNLAMAEMMLVLANIVHRLGFRDVEMKGNQGELRNSILPVPGVTEFELKDHVTSAKDGPYLHFSPSNVGGR